MPTQPSRDPRYHDFDAADDEDKPIPFKLLGKVWQLPPSVPAATILRIQRLMLTLGKMEQTGEVPDDLVISDDLSYEGMAREMVGDDLVDEWLTYEWTKPNGVKAVGISYNMLGNVTRRLYAIHTGDDPDAAGKGQKKAPQDRKRPAKKASARKR